MTRSGRRARLLALELKHGQKKAINACYRKHYITGEVFDAIAARHGQDAANAARVAIFDGGDRPWSSAELARLYTAIRDERTAIARLDAAIGSAPKRETVQGNGWRLIDDTERGLTVFQVEGKVTAKLGYALRGERFTFSSDVGYQRERSEESWRAGLGIGRAIDEGMGERPPDRTDATATAK